jgi:hypothetical protein
MATAADGQLQLLFAGERNRGRGVLRVRAERDRLRRRLVEARDERPTGGLEARRPRLQQLPRELVLERPPVESQIVDVKRL